MCTTCKQNTTPGAPPVDEYTYSVTDAPTGSRVEYRGTIYQLDQLTCCQKRLLFGKTPFITRTLTVVEPVVAVAIPVTPQQMAALTTGAEAPVTTRRKRA